MFSGDMKVGPSIKVYPLVYPCNAPDPCKLRSYETCNDVNICLITPQSQYVILHNSLYLSHTDLDIISQYLLNLCVMGAK